MKYILSFLLLAVLVGLGIFYYQKNSALEDELVEEEQIVEENIDNDDATEGEIISYVPLEASDLIKITNPVPGQQGLTSPLVITGEARGNWFFEATAPVILTDWNGLIIAEGYIEADGEWMTEDFVPFTGILTFNQTDIPDFNNRGHLILQKSNASGLPEHDMAAEMVIFFD